MLTEMANVKQVPGEPRRRWFADDYFDLIVWTGDGGAVEGFQLCYDTSGEAKALTWLAESGYRHENVDTGDEECGKLKGTPILTSSSPIDIAGVAARFSDACGCLEPSLAAFIRRKIAEYEPCSK